VTGSNNVAIGRNAGRTIATNNTVAIGTSARATAAQAVAIGYGSLASVTNTVSVGSGSIKRRIMNVAPGIAASDAVTVAQLNGMVSEMAQAQSAAAPTSTPDSATVIAALQRRLDELSAEVKQLRQLAERQASAAGPR
jgi:autotransporter adhesin